MASVLVGHALNKLACNYNALLKSTYTLPRITILGGAFASFKSAFNSFDLPTKNTYYHLYELHLDSQDIFGVNGLYKNTWYTLASVYQSTHMRFSILTATGGIMHLSLCYLRVKANGTLIIAVPVITKINSTPDAALILEVFYNDYYTRTDAAGSVSIVSGTIGSSQDSIALQATISSLSSVAGSSLVYILNGRRVYGLSIASLSKGDYYEVISEQSVYKVVDFKYSTLLGFNSTLDAKQKFLLHYDGNDSGMIDHYKHVDIVLMDVVTNKGAVVAQLTEDTIRMITHRDYAISCSVLASYLPVFSESNALDNLYLRLVIHRPARQYTVDSYRGRLDYLYKLTARQYYTVLRSPGLLPAWSAPVLEASDYAKLMRQEYAATTQEVVESAYGYPYISKTFAANPVKPDASGYITRPIAFQSPSTAFEYDANGVLLGYYALNTQIVNVRPVYAGCAYVEFIEGIGQATLDEMYDSDVLTYQSNYHYRAYIRYLNNPSVDPSVWADVTDTALFSNRAWAGDALTYATKRLVRSDRNFLLYSTPLTAVMGNYSHQVTYRKVSGGSTVSSGAPVPLLDYDFFLNGHPLIKDVDYRFKHPVFTLCTSKYLKATGENTLMVRGTGFCKNDMTIREDDESGIVFNGVISKNSNVYPYSDTCNRIIVGGKMIMDDPGIYAETTNNGPLVNGEPYAIKERATPLIGILLKNDPWKFYETCKQEERAVMAFVNTQMGEANTATLNFTTGKYPLYSPFITYLITALKSGIYPDTLISTLVTKNDMDTVVNDFSNLLPFDPVTIPGLDLNYFDIFPLPFKAVASLTTAQFNFLMRVIAVYCANRIYTQGMIAINNGAH